MKSFLGSLISALVLSPSLRMLALVVILAMFWFVGRLLVGAYKRLTGRAESGSAVFICFTASTVLVLLLIEAGCSYAFGGVQ